MIPPSDYSSHSASRRHNFESTSKTYNILTPRQRTRKRTASHTTNHNETNTHKNLLPPYKYDTLQLVFLTTHHENIKTYDNEFTLYKIPIYIIKKRNNHHAHDKYLYRRWNNNPTARSKTKRTRKTNQRLLVTAKDDTSVTPTLETLCTQDKQISHSTNFANDTILSP